MVKDITIGVGGLGFEFRAGQIGHNVTNGVVLPGRSAAEMGPAARYTLQRNTASITLFFLFSLMLEKATVFNLLMWAALLLFLLNEHHSSSCIQLSLMLNCDSSLMSPWEK